MTHYLSVLVLVPIVGVALVTALPARYAPTTARVVIALGCALSCPLWWWYRPTNPNLQFAEHLGLASRVGIDYQLGVDGIGLLFVALAGVMCLAAAVVHRTADVGAARADARRVLASYASLLVLFLAANAATYAVAWAALLVSAWKAGGPGETESGRGLSGVAVAVASILLVVATTWMSGPDVAGRSVEHAQSARWTSAVSAGLVIAWVAVSALVPMVLLRVGTWGQARAAGLAESRSVLVCAMVTTAGAYGALRYAVPLSGIAASVWLVPAAWVACAAVPLAALMWTESTWEGKAVWTSAAVAVVAVASCLRATPLAMDGGIRLIAGGALLSAALALRAVRRGEREVSIGVDPSTPGPAFTAMMALGVGVLAAAVVRAGDGSVLLWPGALLLAVGVVYRGVVSSGVSLSTAAGALAAAATVWLASGPMSVSTALRVPTLKLAAALDSRYEREFVAACDTTVTPEMKAASPAAQFLAAAPCGPDGKPLAAGAPMAPSLAGTPIDGGAGALPAGGSRAGTLVR